MVKPHIGPASGPLQSLLDELREQHGVVGASLGILKGDEIEVYASGLLNLDTRVACTPDSVFQIGSIGKVFTATLVLQLVDEEKLDIDASVIEYLPDFALADHSAARSVTIRQLLNHTSGIDGDFLPADESEGWTTANYARQMRSLGNLFPPGQGPSTYSNSGYVLAGRIVEVLTRQSWQDLVVERICAPLAMPAAFSRPEKALRFRCAIGHELRSDQDKLRLAEQCYLPASLAPAGSMLSLSMGSLLTFVSAHINQGEHRGARILSIRSTRLMQHERVAVPPFTAPGMTHRGLGWLIGEGSKYRMIGHDGSTAGQFAYLRAFPERKIAFALLTNSPSAKMFAQIEARLMRSLLEAERLADPPPETFQPRADRYLGEYRNIAERYEVSAQGRQLSFCFRSEFAGMPSQEVLACLEPYCADIFELRSSNPNYEGRKVSFIGDDEQGRARFIRLGGRMGRRMSIGLPRLVEEE